jgi:hypothetical protein
MSPGSRSQNARVKKFLTPEPKDLTKRAVEAELRRIRPQFGFTDAELRRLREPRRKRAASA